MKNFIVGANQTDKHYENVNCKDFKAEKVGDLCQVQEGDICPCCHQPLTLNMELKSGTYLS